MSLPESGSSDGQLPVGKALPHTRASILPRGGFTLPSGGPFKDQNFNFFSKLHWGLREAVTAKEPEEKPGITIRGQDGEEKEPDPAAAGGTGDQDTTGETILVEELVATPAKHKTMVSMSSRSPAQPKVAVTDLGGGTALPDLSFVPNVMPEGFSAAPGIPAPIAATTPMSLKKRPLSARPKIPVIPGSRTHV